MSSLDERSNISILEKISVLEEDNKELRVQLNTTYDKLSILRDENANLTKLLENAKQKSLDESLKWQHKSVVLLAGQDVNKLGIEEAMNRIKSFLEGAK